MDPNQGVHVADHGNGRGSNGGCVEEMWDKVSG